MVYTADLKSAAERLEGSTPSLPTMKHSLWNKMGFVWDGKAHGLYWTEKGHLWWLPEFAKNAIMIVVNKVCCSIWGHYWFPHSLTDNKKRVCVMCCKVESVDNTK